MDRIQREQYYDSGNYVETHLLLVHNGVFLGLLLSRTRIWYDVRFFVTPKPTEVDEHMKPRTRPYYQKWQLVHIFIFPEVWRLYHVVVPILQRPSSSIARGIWTWYLISDTMFEYTGHSQKTKHQEQSLTRDWLQWNLCSYRKNELHLPCSFPCSLT